MLHLQSWKRHFFCLTKDKLFWTEEQTRSEEDDDDEGLEGAGAGEVNMMVKCIYLLNLSLKDITCFNCQNGCTDFNFCRCCFYYNYNTKTY